MTGIGSTLAVGRFVTAAKAVEKVWSGLTKDERANRLCDAANAELHAIGVPAVVCEVSDINTIGQFIPSDWRMAVGVNAFSQTSLSAEDAAGVADTIYHEARHAEQAHRVARYVAGQDKKLSTEEIAAKARVPEAIAKDAKEKPLSGNGAEAKEAQQFYDSTCGDGAASTEAVYSRQAEILTKARQTKDAYTFVVWLHTQNMISDQRFAALTARKEELKQELINDINPMNALYQALPEEADAFRVGDAVTKAYAGKSVKK